MISPDCKHKKAQFRRIELLRIAGVGLKTTIYQSLTRVMRTPYVSPALFSSPALPVLCHTAHSRRWHRTKSSIQAGMMHTRIQAALMLCFQLSAPLSALCLSRPPLSGRPGIVSRVSVQPCRLAACPHPLPLFSLGLVPYPTPGAFVGVPLRVSEGTRIRKLYRFPQIKKKPPLMVRQHPGAFICLINLR